ncbi:carbon-nitrogen hydrolase family protein [Glaciecola petra]|uniref:Carbon-nitrogen hydrolase family protein n=1 Tax=Glaciecola petra TaxID=3075602 RepID=A0ABU2ZSM6_9ALTE|nr:carbon-nitrogen hydrolase family protein [Aestuariibacter sp. P117]MDT0595638.1 carbon-nitrogen hydrolase family protein [Aestuariibacter sp. P117]
MINLISIQINGQDKVEDNLDKIEALMDQACASCEGEKLVVLPECCSLFGVSGQAMLAHAESPEKVSVQKVQEKVSVQKAPIQIRFSAMARRNQCYLVAGTTPMKPSLTETTVGKDKYFAASLVYGPDGSLVSRYDKIHLFDVEVADKTQSYLESKYTEAGSGLALFKTSFGEVAQSVCYDLRFADMFGAYAKFTENGQAPNVIVVPSAFTKVTGKAHWHTLLRARSIENQCFVVASNQVGKHADGRQTFGNSCIYSPWGDCLDIIEDEEGFVSVRVDNTDLSKIRAKMPVNSHKKERYQIERKST